MSTITQSIWEEYQRTRDPALRERICAEYIGLVRLIANRMIGTLPSHVEMDDLVANGFVGLLHAIDRYDPKRGYKFETYATSRIRGAILDGLRAIDWLPTSVRKRVRELEEKTQQLESALGRPAQDVELAEHLGITVDELATRLLEAMNTTVVSLNELWLEGEGRTIEWSDVLANPRSDDPFEHAWLNAQRDELARAIDELPEKERLIVSLHYYEGLTGAEIARIMELTPSRISQLHARALQRLRNSLHRA